MDLFYLWLRHCLIPSWLGALMPQRRHKLANPQTREYRLKKKIVKNVWLISGATMLMNPVLYIILPLALFTTFLSFSILDETP